MTLFSYLGLQFVELFHEPLERLLLLVLLRAAAAVLVGLLGGLELLLGLGDLHRQTVV